MVSAGTLKSQAEGFLSAQPATPVDAKNLTAVLGADRTLATQVSSIKDLLTSPTQATDGSLRALGAAIAQVAPSSAVPVDPNVAALALLALNAAKATAYKEAGLPFDPKAVPPYFYNSVSGSFYELVSFTGIKSYDELQALAKTRKYGTRTGRLAAILTPDDNRVVWAAIQSANIYRSKRWIVSGICNLSAGGCQGWRIPDGPFPDKAISTLSAKAEGGFMMVATPNSFANWFPGEGVGGEAYIELNFYPGGLWNNVGDPFDSGTFGYVVQYD